MLAFSSCFTHMNIVVYVIIWLASHNYFTVSVEVTNWMYEVISEPIFDVFENIIQEPYTTIVCSYLNKILLFKRFKTKSSNTTMELVWWCCPCNCYHWLLFIGSNIRVFLGCWTQYLCSLVLIFHTKCLTLACEAWNCILVVNCKLN